MELSIGLRNKVEHRYHEAINEVAMEYAQALLLNYKKKLTATFGADFSLGDLLLVQLPPWSGKAQATPR
jgi:hypothetical protein